MSDDVVLDLTDPDVLRMVLADHEPKYRWAGAGKLAVVVECRTCRHAWPCDTITAAREYERRDRRLPPHA